MLPSNCLDPTPGHSGRYLLTPGVELSIGNGALALSAFQGVAALIG